MCERPVTESSVNFGVLTQEMISKQFRRDVFSWPPNVVSHVACMKAKMVS